MVVVVFLRTFGVIPMKSANDVEQLSNAINSSECHRESLKYFLIRVCRPITVTLMFEALCPFCQKFIATQLANLYDQFRGKVEIELVPFGNARLLPNGQISCNHGQAECDANKLMSCVVDVVQIKQARNEYKRI
jgi:hypothetical protein